MLDNGLFITQGNRCVCVCVCACVCVCVCVCMFSHSVVFSSLPQTVVCLGPLSVNFLQARTLEQVAISLSKGSSQPRDRTCVSCVFCIDRQILLPLASGVFSFLSASIHAVGSHPFRKLIKRNV